ncbi:MAG TPA: DUF924 family protein [Polyangia bacterium]|jgi:uncharacterized protein (DUF924 family)|nr:DUF924 family protein [Polyangia bacterium]
MTDAAAVLSYWFGDERDPIDSIGALERRGTKWFYGGPEIDREIAERFGGDLERARRGELEDWAETPRERLALIVLLDQFSRNVFRGTPLSYAQDAIAQRLAVTGLEASMDQDLALHERLFFSLPLSHAEDNVLQERGLAYAERVTNEAPPAVRSFYERGLEFVRKHHDVVARFGRFPTRNATLGRASTPQEITYLEELKITGAML